MKGVVEASVAPEIIRRSTTGTAGEAVWSETGDIWEIEGNVRHALSGRASHHARERPTSGADSPKP